MTRVYMQAMVCVCVCVCVGGGGGGGDAPLPTVKHKSFPTEPHVHVNFGDNNIVNCFG